VAAGLFAERGSTSTGLRSERCRNRDHKQAARPRGRVELRLLLGNHLGRFGLPEGGEPGVNRLNDD
jgi:hypothetical protein